MTAARSVLMLARQPTRSAPTRALKIAAVVAAGLVALHLGAATVLGHTVLLRSDPPDGAWLPEPPREIRLWFSESVLPASARVTLIGSDGQRYEATVQPVPGDPAQLVVSVQDLPRGAYQLSWSTVSADDLHPISGSAVFGVRAVVDPAGSTPAAPPPNLLLGLLGWLATMMLALALGAAISLRLMGVDPPAAAASVDLRRRLGMRLATLGVVAPAAAALVGIGQLLQELVTLRLPGGPGSLLATAWGGRWLATEVTLVVLTILMIIVRRQPVPTTSRRLAVGIGVVVAFIFVVRALGAHPTSGEGGSILNVLVGALHSAAALSWAGTLCVLVVMSGPLLAHPGVARATAFGLFRRFGPYAAACVGVAAVSGLLLAGRVVTSLDALLLTTYGQLLVAKLAIAAAAAALGLRHASTLHGALRRTWRRLHAPGWILALVGLRWMRVTLRLEGLAAAGVIGLASLLAVTAPANGPEFRPALPMQEPPPITGRLDDLVLTATIRPGRAGPNFIGLGVFDTRRPTPAVIDSVTVVLQPASGGAAVSAVARPVGDGQYETDPVVLAHSGDWQVSISVARANLPVAKLVDTWTAAAAPPPVRPVTFGSWPLAPLLTAAASVMALFGMALAGALARPLRRRSATAVAGGLSGVPAPRVTPR
jgi:copper transport protein